MILIGCRIGTHQSNGDIDRVCWGPSEQARPPTPTPRSCSPGLLQGADWKAALPRAGLRPPSQSPLPRSRAGTRSRWNHIPACAGLPQLTSPRSGGSEGAGVRFQGARSGLPELRGPAHWQPASQSHGHGQGAPCICNLWLP